MTDLAFASLSGTMFATVVRARQDYVTAARALDIAEEACTCERRCVPGCDARDARRAFDAAGAARLEREQAWAAYCALR